MLYYIQHNETLIEEQKTDALPFVTIFGEGMSKCQVQTVNNIVFIQNCHINSVYIPTVPKAFRCLQFKLLAW